MENLSGNPEEILTNEERDNILNDLFLWKEWALDSSFLYKWKGAELYANISKDKSYPFIDIEISCLENLKYKRKFKKILNKTEYITDVWSWDGQKAVALLKRTSWQWTYIPEDYSRQMLKIAENKVREDLPLVKLWSSQKLNNGKHLSQQCQNNMYLFLWWTICNMTDDEIVDELKNMDNSWIINWNKILLSYFTAPNTQEEIDDLIRIYNSDNNRAFHENWMKMLWLSKDDFEYDTVYEKDDPTKKEWPFPWKIKWIIRAKKDTIVELSNWRTIQINKWQEFTIHYSRRFTKSWIEKLFKESWCNVVFSVDEKWDSIVLLKKKPQKMWKLKNTFQKILTWALIVGSLTGYSVKSSQLKEAKEKEKVYSMRKSNIDQDRKPVLYYQETKELISALQLDELSDEETKNTIIDLFNKYVQEHKTEWVTSENLIQWFWKEYGWILIKDFGITHSPYDFMTPEVISNTKNIQKEISLWKIKKTIQNAEVIESYKYDNVFEYNDSWEIYFILKVYVWEANTPIYLAAKKKDFNKNHIFPLSTNTVKEIKDKSKLDQSILENSDMFWNLITHNIDEFWHKRPNTWPILLSEDFVEDINTDTLHLVFLNWKVYYVKIGITRSMKIIWLASKSPSWPFTTEEFNEISEVFNEMRKVY